MNKIRYIFLLFLTISGVLSNIGVEDQSTAVNEHETRTHAHQHTNNWAVIVSTSRFWFNYRHMANALSIYRTVKRLGIPDSQIILMLSDDIACNPRNAFQGEVFNNADRQLELYGDNVKVDYRGYEVTVENFIRLLTDRWPENHPRSKRLLTDENSNILIYLTGHGGDEFLKFQDAEEISSYDIADAFEQMNEKKRYNEIFFMIDTCQANTMYSKFYSPNILSCGSSELHESSYSHHSDTEIGVAVIDRFTYYTLEFLENVTVDSSLTLEDLFDSYTFEKIHSNAGVRLDLFGKKPSDVLITDFFGNVQKTFVDNVEEDLLFLTNADTDGHLREIKHNDYSIITNETSSKVNGRSDAGNSGYRPANQNVIKLNNQSSTNYSIIILLLVIVSIIFTLKLS